MIKHITSRSNPRIKSLLTEKENNFFFEGEKLVRDLLRKKIPIHRLIINHNLESEFKSKPHGVEELWLVSPPVLRKLSSLKEKSDFLAMVKFQPKKIRPAKEPLILAMDSVQDPANAGTIFRCASAFGIGTVIFCGDCVSPTNPKFIRTAQTAIFDVRFKHISRFQELIRQAREANLNIYLTSPRPSKKALPLKDILTPALIVFGNEGQGLLREHLNQFPVITIEQKKGVESLNVGISACIIMHQLKNIQNR